MSLTLRGGAPILAPYLGPALGQAVGAGAGVGAVVGAPVVAAPAAGIEPPGSWGESEGWLHYYGM